MRLLSIIISVAILAAAAPAASQLRTLDVPPDKGWQHARTGLILMGKLGQFQRASLRDNGTFELDVIATYRTADQKSTASIFLYRPGVLDVPLWFDRSHTVMLRNRDIKVGAPIGPVTRFVPPGSTTHSALRIVYPIAGQPSSATGLAMIPFGEWLVAVRLTSDTMDPAALDAALTELVGKVRWPASIAPAKVANPVQQCASPLKFKRAKPIKPDLAQALMASVLGFAMRDVADKKGGSPAPAVEYCLEESSGVEFSAYRPIDSRTHYVVAFGDAGVAANVSPEFNLDGETGQYAVVLEDWDSSDSYPSFTAMPTPKQVFELVQRGSPVASASRGGKDIAISPSAK